MAVGKRRDVEQVADVRGEPGEEIGDRQAACGHGRVQRADRGEVSGEGAHVQAAEVVFAHRRRGIEEQIGDGLAEVADIEQGNAAGGGGRQRMHRPARDAADPACSEAAFTVEQRWPHDVPVGIAGAQGGLAVALGTQEAAAGGPVQPQRGDMDHAQSACGAGSGERGGCAMVDAVVGFASALAEDADAVDHRIAAVDDIAPGIGIEEAFEVGLAAGEVAQARAADPATGAATSDDHAQAARAQGTDDMAADETCAAEDEHDRCGVACGRLGVGRGGDCESAHALLLFDGSVGYFCLDRNI